MYCITETEWPPFAQRLSLPAQPEFLCAFMAAIFLIHIDNCYNSNFEHKDLRPDRYCSHDEFWCLAGKRNFDENTYSKKVHFNYRTRYINT